MLKKLLKHDLKAIFKFWWIAAVISVILAVAGGFAQTVLNSERELPEAVMIIASMLRFFVYFSFFVLFLLTMVLIFSRFYKNFFTDEGYLTFTLPASRRQLLNSKLIAGVTAIASTVTLLIVNMLVIFLISDYEYITSPVFYENLQSFFRTINEELGIYFWIYSIELLVLLLLCALFSLLFLFCCVTFASMIVKKGKLIAAIGIYYLANSIFSSALQIFYLFGITSLTSWLSPLPRETIPSVGALLALGLICFVAMICGLLYVLQHWMLERKLNLN